ncbi:MULTISPECIES: hypothetical protein [unclassified Leifsonia]|uniref:hypothetical protein n=1 Tax=unclassified Leifsonia TaxID=2663824 RepID=UPI0008A75ED0|nr:MULTISPECIES: hypothetical protein [unclassified Leifsonia]SEI11709.1 hypothetical protein SAMN04515694_1178 [Leifsonia sp. CL154]SFL95119.1 hypothetical protein SAMN04515692_11867 [Leifsonia sp. CL147]
MLAALITAAGIALLPGAVARADAGSGNGSGDDGSLHLIPEIITNAGVSAGGSSDFPVKAQLFLPAVAQHARDREKSQEAITGAVGRMSFSPQSNPLFTRAYTDLREGLFVDYTPQAVPSDKARTDAQSNDIWILLTVVAAIPLTLLAVYLGRKNASRRMNRHGRATP